MTEPIKWALVAVRGALLRPPANSGALSPVDLRLNPAVLPSLLELQQRGVRVALVDYANAANVESLVDFATDLCESQGLDTARIVATSVTALQQALELHLQQLGCRPAAAVLFAPSGVLLEAGQALGLQCAELPVTDCSPATWPALVRRFTARTAVIARTTKETRIAGRIDLDATSPITISTGIGFFDHMLEQLAKHGGFALELRCEGDLEIDEHHTVEDCALALGDALRNALGAKLGIGRYGFLLAMDEAEAQVAIDLSGRAYALFEGKFGRESVGGLPTELVPHFYRSLADSLGAAIHVTVRGDNAHHMVEASFKSVGRALRQAIAQRGHELPSTKGTLT